MNGSKLAEVVERMHKDYGDGYHDGTDHAIDYAVETLKNEGLLADESARTRITELVNRLAINEENTAKRLGDRGDYAAATYHLARRDGMQTVRAVLLRIESWDA